MKNNEFLCCRTRQPFFLKIDRLKYNVKWNLLTCTNNNGNIKYKKVINIEDMSYARRIRSLLNKFNMLNRFRKINCLLLHTYSEYEHES